MDTAHVVVLGAGIPGLMTAVALADAGHSVVVIDHNDSLVGPAGPHADFGGLGAVINQVTTTARPALEELIRQGLAAHSRVQDAALMRRVEDQQGPSPEEFQPWLHLAGVIVLADRSHPTGPADQVASTTLSRADLAQLAPSVRLNPGGAEAGHALLIDSEGYLDDDRLIAELVSQLTEAGVAIVAGRLESMSSTDRQAHLRLRYRLPADHPSEPGGWGEIEEITADVAILASDNVPATGHEVLAVTEPIGVDLHHVVLTAGAAIRPDTSGRIRVRMADQSTPEDIASHLAEVLGERPVVEHLTTVPQSSADPVAGYTDQHRRLYHLNGGALSLTLAALFAEVATTEVGARGPHARDHPPEPTYADHLLAEFRPEMS